MRFVVLLQLLFLGWGSAMAATPHQHGYSTVLLRQLASRIGFTVDTLRVDSGTYSIGKYQGHALTADLNKNGVVENIGVALFPTTMKAQARSDRQVMRFLERYMLELLTLRDVRLVDKKADDKVFFRKGDLNTLLRNAQSDAFSLIKHTKYYEATWTRKGTADVTIVFPPNIELISGATAVELKDGLQEQLRGSSQNALSVEAWQENALEKKADGIWTTRPVTYYGLKTLNDAVYLKKDGTKYVPVFNAKHIEESALNLALGVVANSDYRLVVEQTLYGFKNATYTVSLNKWLNYCADNGLKLYAAVEEVRDDGVKLFVLAESKDFGFNHVLSLVVPNSVMSDGKGVLKGKLTPFIPTDNVKNLYEVSTKTNHKKNRQ